MNSDYFDQQTEEELKRYNETEGDGDMDTSLFPDGTYRMKVKPLYSKKNDAVWPSFYTSDKKGALMLKIVLESIGDTENTKSGKLLFHNVYVAPKPGSDMDAIAKAARMSKPVFKALIGTDDFIPNKEWVERCSIEYDTDPEFKVTKDHIMKEEVMVKIETDWSDFQKKEVNVVKRVFEPSDGDVSKEVGGMEETPVNKGETSVETPSEDALEGQVEDY